MENKQEKIIEMFNNIAPTYDRANRIMSFGVDISWRKKACEYALNYFKNSEISIVDVACGTGDMMDFWQKSAQNSDVKITNLIGIDPSIGMLEVAKQKFADFKFIQASATNTTLNDQSAQILSISYGIRNVVERQKALQEFWRVLAPNGLLVVLEFTKAQKSGVIPKVRDFYVGKILPKIGAWVSKNREAYEYLPSSIDNFLNSANFIAELENTGFKMLKVQGFSFDVCTLFVAQKVTKNTKISQ